MRRLRAVARAIAVALAKGSETVLDRLEGEGEQERLARERAAAAQRALLEAMPFAISVVSEADGQVLYANHNWSHPFRLPAHLAGDPRDLLNLLYPEDRAAVLEEHRRRGQVDGFQARCRTPEPEPHWVMVGTRPLVYQGIAARLTICTSINDRRRAEAALARRTAMLDAIAYAATRMVGAGDWRPGMQDLLSRLGTAADVSRVFLFEVHPAPDGSGLAQSVRFDWAAPGLPPLTGDPRYTNEPYDDSGDDQFAEWHRRRRRGEVVQVRLRETRGAARQLFEESGTLSMLSVPVFVEGVFWGTLGFDDCRVERIWDQADIDVLRTATALIAGAIGRAQSDQRLREREALLVEAQRIAHVGSWELDFATDTLTWSDEGWRIFGLEPGERIWTHAENLQRIHPEDRERVARMDALAQEQGEGFEMEYRIVRRNGEIRTVRERAEPVRDASGRPVRLIGTVHDVTEIKATEARLRESEERYALAARGAEIGLWDWDVAADRAYFSPRLHEILGVQADTLGPGIGGLFDRLLPEDRLALDRHLARRFERRRRKFEMDVRARRADEQVRWLVVRGLIVYGEHGPVRLVGSVRDVTDRRRADEELIRQREALHQNEKMAMFGSLLAGVAHELNNPLSAVVGQAALLQETAKDPAVADRAARIRRATDRCARIVRTFLAMARQQPSEPKPTALNAIIEMAIDLFAYQLRAADIRVEQYLAADLPPVMVDPDQLHQVITNLLANARQALAARGGERRLRIATRADRAEGLAHVSIADNGPGIPADLEARVFEPFFTTKPVGEGTGIGLSLCASIVRAHGGAISYSPTPGGGATFTVSLPLHEGADAPSDEDEDDAATPGLRVLIVEDELEIAETLRDILRSRGHVADIAADGQQGLDRVARRDYDLVLSDLRMPVLDGPGFYRALRQRRPDMAERIGFITGDALSPEIQAFLNRSGVQCLEKPFLPDEVMRLVAQVLSRGQQGAFRG